MKTKALISEKNNEWALPGNSVSREEFKKGIKKAVNGSFYTVRKSKQFLEELRKRENSR